MTDATTTLCEGNCQSEVPVDETSACPYCGRDPLCNDCSIPTEHQCPGKPGEPGELTLEVGQRVQDKFEQEKSTIGRIDEVEGEFVTIHWRQPTMKQAKITKAQATALLENSNRDWDTLEPEA